MNIKPSEKTIRELLGSKHQFIIPRFQREYSWEKKNATEFLVDMLNNLAITDTKIVSSQYFLGTMLFIGDFTESVDAKISVVDGQQRLTTITILFSVLSDIFKEMGEVELSKQIFQYIMTTDDDGKPIRVLQSKTHYPYFSYFIQDIDKKVREEPESEEELCIKNTYDLFYSNLSDAGVKKILSKSIDSAVVNALNRLDILKALRDQVLNTTFVSISTTDKDQANRIFEILNAKGKQLAYIDLIKNRIFEILNETEPADYAENRWEMLKSILYAPKETVGLATFYRHYWISKYNKKTENQLYDAFSTTIKKDPSKCRELLEDLIRNAKIYVQILNPNRADYNNKKQYYELVQSINIIINYFNIVQVRIALLALIDAKNRKIIGLKTLTAAVRYLEFFHFAYNAVLSMRTNRFEKIYSIFAIEMRKASTKDLAHKIIEEKLKAPLERIFPKWEEFTKGFEQLSYSKDDRSSNVKCKYAINMINCMYSGKALFEDDGTIEHIIPETDEQTLNIGNLILLEEPLNKDAKDKTYTDKLATYSISQYKWIKEFIVENPDWERSKIPSRAKILSRLYYSKIFGKPLKGDN